MRIRMEKAWSDVLKLAGITIVVYCGIRYILPVVVPFLFAAIFAVLLHPVVDKLEKKIKLPRGLFSFLVLAGVVLLILLPLGWILWKLLLEACSFLGKYELWEGKIRHIWCECCVWMEELTGRQADFIEAWGETRVEQMSAVMGEKVLPILLNCSVSGIRYIAGIAWKLLVTLVAAVMILTDYKNLRKWFDRTVFGRILKRLGTDTIHAGGTYLKAQFFIMFVITAICVLGLFLTGNPYALLAGIGIGVCDALPFLGTGTVFFPWLFICIFQKKYMLAVWYGVLYLICTLVREFMEPKLVGKGIGVHPLIVIFSLYVGICVYGASGIILGPLSALLIWEIYRMDRKEDAGT